MLSDKGPESICLAVRGTKRGGGRKDGRKQYKHGLLLWKHRMQSDPRERRSSGCRLHKWISTVRVGLLWICDFSLLSSLFWKDLEFELVSKAEHWTRYATVLHTVNIVGITLEIAAPRKILAAGRALGGITKNRCQIILLLVLMQRAN